MKNVHEIKYFILLPIFKSCTCIKRLAKEEEWEKKRDTARCKKKQTEKGMAFFSPVYRYVFLYP